MNQKVTWVTAIISILINSNTVLAETFINKNNLRDTTIEKSLLASLPVVSCNTNLTVGEEYACIVSGASQGARYSLKNAPTGMAIQYGSGHLHWTPASNQSGTQTATILRTLDGQQSETPITFTVQAGTTTSQNAIYLAPNGNDNNSGISVDQPLLSLHKAASLAQPGDTIYLRGGTYTNEGFGNSFIGRRNNLARITNSGSPGQEIIIRPHGNEYVKLKSDVNGIVFKGASYWKIQGIEFQGTAQQIDPDQTLKLWWDDTDASNEIKGQGIAMNTSFEIEIVDCIVRDFPGAGVSNNGGANITLKDSVVYNNAWWSFAGTHGFANSKPATPDQNNPTDFKMTMTGNLVFGNQSSMISHVFSKGFVKLEIDEGNGLHMQNTEGLFYGRFLAENNLVMYNGKAGLGLNTIANSTIRNNSFYQNAQAVDGSGELSLQPPDPNSNPQPNVIKKNLFHALPDRQTLKVFNNGQNDLYEGISNNYAVPALDAEAIKDNVTQANSVFVDPQNLNFSPASGITADYGVPQDTLDSFTAKIEEYGITPKPAKTKVNDPYIKKLKIEIFKRWPAPNPNDTIPDNLVLEDGDSGLCYTYEQRGDYPAPPRTKTPCKK
ncbi:hypothetical protein I4641_00295 [Waterburya agarophytonicola K14]|uniref:Right handed beta helix domain-containing protein n=1 Tax=Waterburya agarophytonicola KI4 TaxID=2874699 RepID=A0A964FDC7_9CYAN|nr:right-handed parallel beta-helix repeat-containing protein [Waterburya agarophytonicola]MCC0175420.1 hypothetical protein [Waterburya agarophytonicola KI4]